MLDYDKKFLLKSADNLTFDGSSIRGFTAQQESDLRLALDWSAFYWLPSDVFGAGKVLVFGEVIDRDGTPYPADLRGQLKKYGRADVGKRQDRLLCGARNRRLLVQGPRRRAPLPRVERVRVRLHRRLLPLAAGRHLRRFIDARPRRSGRWASPTRRTTPRWRPPSSR